MTNVTHHFSGQPVCRIFRFFVLAFAAIFILNTSFAQSRYSGSDTVEPVVTAGLASFSRVKPDYKFIISSTGTSAGFRDLCAGRVFLAGASRPISTEETKICSAAGINPLEIAVGYDAITLVVSSKNTWLKNLTFQEIQALFEPKATNKLVSWKMVRSTFPDAPLRVAGPDVKHGTFASFSGALGLKGFMRSDYKDFKHHEETAKFVEENADVIGYMPLSDALAMGDRLRVVAIDFGSGPIVPSHAEVALGRYDKLSRVVYFYLNRDLLQRASDADKSFVKYILDNAEKLVKFAGLAPLNAIQYRDLPKKAGLGG